MAIFLKGDTHGDLSAVVNFIEKMNLGENDSIIILGDFGLLWEYNRKREKEFIEFYEKNYKCNIYFIRGNHENYNLLNKIPIENDLGKVSEHISYLLDGKVYILDGISFLIMGGADSVDKYRRIEGLNWWKEEAVSAESVQNVITNSCCRHINFVLTHTAPKSIVEEYKPLLCTLDLDETKLDRTSENLLDVLKEKIDFDYWCFGHFHQDVQLNDKFFCFMNDFKDIQQIIQKKDYY